MIDAPELTGLDLVYDRFSRARDLNQVVAGRTDDMEHRVAAWSSGIDIHFDAAEMWQVDRWDKARSPEDAEQHFLDLEIVREARERLKTLGLEIGGVLADKTLRVSPAGEDGHFSAIERYDGPYNSDGGTRSKELGGVKGRFFGVNDTATHLNVQTIWQRVSRVQHFQVPMYGEDGKRQVDVTIL